MEVQNQVPNQVPQAPQAQRVVNQGPVNKKNHAGITIVIGILLLLLVGGGVYYWQSMKIGGLRELINAKDIQIQDLNTKNNSLSSEVSELEEIIALEEEKKEKSKIVFDILKDSEFYPKPSNRTLISVAILMDNRDVCDELEGNDVEFCKAAFDGNCSNYQNPNLEICKRSEALLNRKVYIDELIEHCNSKENVTSDIDQELCFNYFAKNTNNVDLCDKICKNPIDNTNCRAVEIDENYNQIPYGEAAIEYCKNNVLGIDAKRFGSSNEKADSISIDFNNCEDIKKIVSKDLAKVSIWNGGLKGDDCVFEYWEDLDWDDEPVIWSSCLVPISLGKMEFEVNEKGVDFGNISQYCNVK